MMHTTTLAVTTIFALLALTLINASAAIAVAALASCLTTTEQERGSRLKRLRAIHTGR